jgi:transcriptional regulatory protein RtcR
MSKDKCVLVCGIGEAASAVLRVYRAHSTLAAAGRAQFSVSRAQKASVNDADRLRKYLTRFGLDWAAATRR